MTSVTAFGANGRSASAASRFELRHRLDGSLERAVRGAAVAHRLQNEARAERLREEHDVAGPRAALQPDPVRVDRADDGEPVLRLVVADRVAAGEDRPRLAGRLGGAGEHVPEHLHGQLLRERRHGQREQRPPAHREHVVERVRRRDAPEGPGVVDDRREEVDGEDERRLIVEAVDGGVVGRVEPDEQVVRPRPGRSRRAAPRAARPSTSRRSRRPARGS